MKKNNILLMVMAMAWLHIGMAGGKCLADSMQVRVRAGYSIGATTPIGIPAEIRSIESLRLTPNFLAGANVHLPLGNRWGVLTGLHIENKGLDGEVTTKGYHMRVLMDESELEGYFTGHVRQKVTQWMLSVPLQASYRPSSRLSLHGGPYVSLLVSSDFSGYAFSGYLRVDDPTGDMVQMGSKDGEWATYDFSDDLRRCQLGLAAGADWLLSRHMGTSVDLSWGLTAIHHSRFKTIGHRLYPIYGTISIFYQL